MSFVIGLTGSIGMGKSTTADMFRDEGVPVWDADATVHKLYEPGGIATQIIAQAYPEIVIDGAVSRPKLRALIADDPSVMEWVQGVVHPLVAEDRNIFINSQTSDIVVLDIPLLFETGTAKKCDMTVVVSVPSHVQKSRVMARGKMTETEFQMILSRQMPDAEKRDRADHVIETLTLDQTRADVRKLLQDLRRTLADA